MLPPETQLLVFATILGRNSRHQTCRDTRCFSFDMIIHGDKEFDTLSVTALPVQI